MMLLAISLQLLQHEMQQQIHGKGKVSRQMVYLV